MKSILRLLTLLLLLSACSAGKQQKKKGVTAPVQSAPYEMLIVANKEWLQTTAGQALMNVAESDVEGLAMHEPCFRCTKINPVNFDGTFKMYGNIIVAEIGGKYQQAEMRVSRNLYCRPQLIVFLAAPNDKAFIELLDSRRDQLLDMFNEQEFNRESLVLQKKHSGIVARQAQKQFGVSLFAPADIDQVKAGKDFFWASASKQEFRLNICLYTLPLRNLSLKDFVAARDSVMQINIPGGHEGQWMETDSRTVSSKLRKQAEGHDIMVVRGLWDMRGDAMGGPFVSYIQADEQRQRILVCEGFVFAPNEKKRPLIRELEAALQTLKFSDDTHF